MELRAEFFEVVTLVVTDRWMLAGEAVGASVGTDSPYPREQHYSLVYDHFIGRELFGYLLGLLTRCYAADERAVRDRVAAAFHRCFPDAGAFFPAETTYYFSNELLPGNDFRLVDTKSAPQWR